MKIALAFAALATVLVTAENKLSPAASLDANILKSAGFPACAIPCIQEAKSRTECGQDIRCQCTTGWNLIHDEVRSCLNEKHPCPDPDDGAKVRKAGLSICSSFGVKNVGGNSTASITSAGEGASAMATTTRSVVNAPQSKSTSSVAAKGSAVAVARPGLLEMGLVGLAGFLAL